MNKIKKNFLIEVSPGGEAPGPSALDMEAERVVAWGTTFAEAG